MLATFGVTSGRRDPGRVKLFNCLGDPPLRLASTRVACTTLPKPFTLIKTDTLGTLAGQSVHFTSTKRHFYKFEFLVAPGSSQVLKNNLAIPSVIRHFWPLGPPRGVKEVEYLTLKILFVVRGGSGRQGKWNLHPSHSFYTFLG